MSAECPGPLNAGSWLGGCRWLHWLPQSRKNARLGEPSSITIASVEAIAKDQARHVVLSSQSVNRSTGPFQSFCSYQIRVTGPQHLLARGSAFMFSYQIRQPACPCASCYLFAVLPTILSPSPAYANRVVTMGCTPEVSLGVVFRGITFASHSRTRGGPTSAPTSNVGLKQKPAGLISSWMEIGMQEDVRSDKCGKHARCIS